MDVGEILNTAFRLLTEHYWRFFQALVVPFCLLVALNLVSLLELSTAAQVTTMVLGLLVYAGFAIITHRLTILGPNAVPTYGVGSLSQRELLYIVYSFFVALPLVALLIPGVVALASVGPLLLIPGILLGLYILARLSLVFPGIAVDRMVTLKRSWEITQPHQRTMVLVVIVVPFCLSLLLGVVQLIIGAVLPAVVAVGLASLANTLLLVFTITTLSLTYRQIVVVGADSNGRLEQDSDDETR